MEIEPGIHQLSHGRGPFQGFPPPNAFLVAGRESSILIDAGWDAEEDHAARMTYIADARVAPVSELIITHHHPDHAGGAALFHQATGAPLSGHPLARTLIETEQLQGRASIANELAGGETRDLGGLSIDVIHAPGHTRGCLALFVPQLGALVATDTVMGVSTTAMRPPEGNLRAYASTLRMFLEIGAKTIYTGHGAPVAEPDKRLRELLAHREQREHQLLAALREPRTVTQLREAIYLDLPQIRWELAEAQLLTGLHKLIEDGLAREDNAQYTLA